MNEQKLIQNLKAIFRNLDLNDDDTANEMLDTLDNHMDIVVFSDDLKEAFRELNIWSRTEKNTGEVLDVVQGLLNL